MPSFDDMVEEVSGHLRAYSVDQEAKSYLANFMDVADLSFTVVHPDRMTAGLAEVDDELVEVSTVDSITGQVTLFPWGRAQQGTTAVSHPGNSRVTASPRWPRARIRRTLNEVVSSVWPDLWVVRSDQSIVYDISKCTYAVPAEVRRILRIDYETPYGWCEVNGWKLNPAADPALYPTGVSVDIAEGGWPGGAVRITYAAEPSQMSGPSDDFATTTGLADGAADMVCIGAAARLVTAMELAGTQVFTVEHAETLQGRGMGGATAASKYLMQLYQVRLQQERARLFERYPARMRRTW